MRSDKRFCAGTAVPSRHLGASASASGLSPVHAQTMPAVPAASNLSSAAMSIYEAVATALEQNLDLQVQRVNPQLRDLDIAG